MYKKKLRYSEKVRNLYERIFIFFYKIFLTKNYSLGGELRSISDNGSYITCINNFLKNEKNFYNFKKHPVYRSILEHLSYSEGQEYIDKINTIKNIDLSKTEKYKFLDDCGNPLKFYYEKINYSISPTSLSYLGVISDIKRLFNFKFKNVLEIGCGYGGQYLLMDEFFDIKEYTLLDLKEVNIFVEKYLKHYNVNSKYDFIDSDNFNKKQKTYDFVISNYAFSELPVKLQMNYLEKIISQTKNGYMLMNSGKSDSVFKNHLSLEEIKKFIPNVKTETETPKTANNNYLIYWQEN